MGSRSDESAVEAVNLRALRKCRTADEHPTPQCRVTEQGTLVAFPDSDCMLSAVPLDVRI